MTNHPSTGGEPVDDDAVQQEIARQIGAALDATGSVPAHDPRRHLRVRLRAAQLLVHALRGAEGEAGMRMAWDAAVEEFGTGIELFGSTEDSSQSSPPTATR